ncbi:MAG: hypothetical protein OXI55_06260 [Gammaproteobacteria bacterium]|nr:hypothetical protein [Gammaproteobacteria bacterium]
MMLGSSSSMNEAFGALRHTGTALIKRGTALGPLVPLLGVAVAFVLVALFFVDVAVFCGVPLISSVLVVTSIAIVAVFLFQYMRFARADPDRLQSEHFRVQMQHMQLMGAKGLPEPVSADLLDDPKSNPAEELRESEETDDSTRQTETEDRT